MPKMTLCKCNLQRAEEEAANCSTKAFGKWQLYTVF